MSISALTFHFGDRDFGKRGLDRIIIGLFDDDDCNFSAIFLAFPLFLLYICRKNSITYGK